MIYPWQQTQWQTLWRAKQDNRLPHALLLTGLAGVGKAIFADHLTRALLCQRVTSAGETCPDASDACHACRLILGGAHPNVLLVSPEKSGQAIKVDQIRQLAEFVHQSSLQGEYRIVIINPAQQMNINAANALLKTLEEPASGALLVLINTQDKKLPATILSRCQRILFRRPEHATARTWLQTQLAAEATPTLMDVDLLLALANGAPLAALHLVQDDQLKVRSEFYTVLQHLQQAKLDPLSAAQGLQAHETMALIDLLLSWVSDLLRLQLGGHLTQLVNCDYATALSALCSTVPIAASSALLDHLQHTRALLSTGINLNKQLMLEEMCLRYTHCVISASP